MGSLLIKARAGYEVTDRGLSGRLRAESARISCMTERVAPAPPISQRTAGPGMVPDGAAAEPVAAQGLFALLNQGSIACQPYRVSNPKPLGSKTTLATLVPPVRAGPAVDGAHLKRPPRRHRGAASVGARPPRKGSSLPPPPPLSCCHC